MMIGKIINNYKITEKIGEGGMAAVYLAEHTTLSRKAALKVLHVNLAENKEVLARFEQEAKTLDKLRHPNIVEVYDFGTFENQAYLLMEYVDGMPLDAYIKNVSGPIPEEKAYEMLEQMLRALQYAHDQDIIHRDIKPANFMISKTGILKILDFGIAKILSDSPENYKTKTGQRIGSLAYMSPEQVKGADIDTRTDIYSLGLTLFQMITGRQAFGKDMTEWDLANVIVYNSLPRVKEFYPHASDKVQKIIDKATQKLPENRYLNCQDFIDDLKKKETAKANSPEAEESEKEKNDNKQTAGERRKNVSGEKTVVYNKRKTQSEKEEEKTHKKQAKIRQNPEPEPKLKPKHIPDKRKKKLLLIIFAALVLGIGFLIYFFFLTPPTRWEKTYGSGDSEAHAIAQYGRGNIVTVGYTYSDNTGSLDFFVVNTDRSGELIFQKSYGGERGDMAKDLCIAKNGNIYLTGGHFYEGKSAQFWFLGIDKQGNVIADKKFGEDQWDEANAITQTSDNNFILAGIGKTRSSDKTTLVYKVDENGNVLNKNAVGFESGYAKNLIETEDGNIVLTGISGNYKKKAACIFLDADLREIQSFEIGGDEQFSAQSIAQLSNNRYALAGNTFKTDTTGLARISIINDHGHIQNEYLYERYPESRFNSLIKTSDGNLLAAGYLGETAGEKDSRKGLLIKFSENLGVLWIRTYRQTAVIRQVVETKDGGIAFSGYSFSNDKKRFKVLKANKLGEIYQY